MEIDKFLKKIAIAEYHAGIMHASYSIIREEVPECLVCYNGGIYIPKAYQLGYDAKSRKLHSAILRDTKANYSVVQCRLDEVGEYKELREDER